MGRAQQQGPGAARTFPPTRLEWTAAQEKASMALDVGCFNGELPSPPAAFPPAGLCPGPGEAGGCLLGVALEGLGVHVGWTWNAGEEPSKAREAGRKQQHRASCRPPRLSWCLLSSRRPVLLPGTLLEHGGGAGWRHPEAQVGSRTNCPAHQGRRKGGAGGRSSNPPGCPLGMLGVRSCPRVSPGGTSWPYPSFMSLHMLSPGGWRMAGGAGRWP